MYGLYKKNKNISITVDLQMKLFDSLVATVLLYTSGLVLTPLSTTFQLYRGDSVLLVEETGIPGENNRTVASH